MLGDHCATAQPVGWVERSDTHQLHFVVMMGFAGLNPSYLLYLQLRGAAAFLSLYAVGI